MRSPAYSCSLAPIHALVDQWIPAILDELSFRGREWRILSTVPAVLNPGASRKISSATLVASFVGLPDKFVPAAQKSGIIRALCH